MRFVRAPQPFRTIRRILAALTRGALVATSFALLPTNVADAATVPAATVPAATETVVPTAPDPAKICARLKIIVAKTILCSHGPDPVDAFGGGQKLRQTSAVEEQSVAAAPASERPRCAAPAA